MRDGAEADPIIARAILEGAAQVPGSGDVLIWGWHIPRSHQSGQVRGVWPTGTFNGHAMVFDPGGGDATGPWGRTDWDLKYARGYLTINRHERIGPQRFHTYTISFGTLGWPLLGLFAAWLAPAIPISLAMHRLRRRARRPAARGQCTRCGYDGVRPLAHAAKSPPAA